MLKRDESFDWVVMLHGIGGSSNIWFGQIKELGRQFNILLIDLHGHGESKLRISEIEGYSLKRVARDIVDLMCELGIEKAHFISVSLGTVIARKIGAINPEKVMKQVLAGAVLKMDLLLKIIYYLCKPLVYFMPFRITYRVAAHILLPFKNHKESRERFIQEALKLDKKEFIAWYKLFSEINKVNEGTEGLKQLYVMGSEDYMFLRLMKGLIRHNKVVILEKCGHVCNIEKVKDFNKIMIKYLTEEE